MSDANITAIVTSLKDKPESQVHRILEKMKLSPEQKKEVLSQLGVDGQVGNKIVLPTDTLGYTMALANPVIRMGLRNLMLSTPWPEDTARFVNKIYADFDKSDAPISAEVIRMILLNIGLPKLEAESMAKKAGELALIEDHTQINYLITELSKRAAKLKVRDEIKAFLDNPSQINTFIDKVSQIKELAAYAHVPRFELGAVKPSELFEQYGGFKVIPSFFSFINEALPGGGYQVGQLVMINAVPGGGKTTFMLNEAVYMAGQGLKVFYISLGDMMPQDFPVKITGIVLNKTVTEVIKNLDDLWNTEQVSNVVKNMDVAVLPAGSLTADELYAATTAKISGKEYDVVVVDYDSNIKIETDVSMYERGRMVYETLSAISRDEPFKLVLVGSQIKQSFWHSDLIPLEAAAESSNKQAVVDVMITIGKNSGAKKEIDASWVHAGYINIAKARRGLMKPTSYHPYKLTSSGRILPIGESEYSDLYHAAENNNKRRRY